MIEVTGFTFPYYDDPPTSRFKGSSLPCVPSDRGLKLGLPKLGPRLRHGRTQAILVSVPETAMDKHHRSVTGQDNVRLAGKVSSMEPETIT